MFYHRFCIAVVPVVLIVSQSYGSMTVNYNGSGATAGLSATAVFSLSNGGNTLNITITNTSTSPPADSDMVLSSINFNAGVNITGGSAALNVSLPSAVVNNSGGVWVDANYGGNLNDEYGYSNTGVGNASGSALISGVTAAQVNSLLNSAVTSHSNGGQSVTSFSGVQGGVGGGLDFGIVANGSTGFGNSDFVLNAMDISLTLSSALTDLSFLNDGSYVEFGSDYAYVGDNPPVVPEPASLLVWLGLANLIGGVVWFRRRSQRRAR